MNSMSYYITFTIPNRLYCAGNYLPNTIRLFYNGKEFEQPNSIYGALGHQLAKEVLEQAKIKTCFSFQNITWTRD